MADEIAILTGGCLCGALRYHAEGAPLAAGYCFCADCRKASGSGFIPFIAVPAAAMRLSGESRPFLCWSARGTPAQRNFCPLCGGLVFGGDWGRDDTHTIYAGSLDDPALFRPRMAIFARDRPAWVPLPPGLEIYETMPD